jgi:hypothetical protein
MIEPYLTSDQLATRWGLSPATIKGQRARGIGPGVLHHPTHQRTIGHFTSPVSIISSFGF